MKYLISIFTCCFIINLHAAEKEKDIFELLFNEENGNFFPIISDIRNHVFSHEGECASKEVKDWFLGELMFAEADYTRFLHRSKQRMTNFTLGIRDKGRMVRYKAKYYGHSIESVTTIWYKEWLLENHDQPYARLLRAKIYMDEKMHPAHHSLLSAIYNNVQQYKTIYLLSTLEQERFEFLPKSFQKALMPYVSYALPEGNNNR